MHPPSNHSQIHACELLYQRREMWASMRPACRRPHISASTPAFSQLRQHQVRYLPHAAALSRSLFPKPRSLRASSHAVPLAPCQQRIRHWRTYVPPLMRPLLLCTSHKTQPRDSSHNPAPLFCRCRRPISRLHQLRVMQPDALQPLKYSNTSRPCKV